MRCVYPKLKLYRRDSWTDVRALVCILSAVIVVRLHLLSLVTHNVSFKKWVSYRICRKLSIFGASLAFLAQDRHFCRNIGILKRVIFPPICHNPYLKHSISANEEIHLLVSHSQILILTQQRQWMNVYMDKIMYRNREREMNKVITHNYCSLFE